MTETEREIVKRVVQRVREIALKAGPQMYIAVREATKPVLPLIGRSE
jgi:hypothetical protein